MGHPIPPTDVRVEMADGSRHPLECVYIGVVDGMHRWQAVAVPQGVIAAVLVSVLPPMTEILVPWA